DPPLFTVGAAEIAGRRARPESLARIGLVHQADNGSLAIHEADERAPDRHAEDEGAGAVDRVDDPPHPGVRIAMAVFLSFQTMVRPARRQRLADRPLGRTVRGRNRIEFSVAGLVV